MDGATFALHFVFPQQVSDEGVAFHGGPVKNFSKK
jgi:hypothetical protein